MYLVKTFTKLPQEYINTGENGMIASRECFFIIWKTFIFYQIQ